MSLCDCNQGRLPCSCKPVKSRAIGARPELAAPYKHLPGALLAEDPYQHVADRVTGERPTAVPQACCTPTTEEKALLAAGEYTPEELWGGSQPTCPECIGSGLLKDNSSIEFDGALAAFHAAVWAAAADEELRTAYDEAGLKEAKTLIGMYRAAATQTVDRDAFEADYADWSGRDLQNIREQRLANTYGQPKIAHAWRWYQHGKGVPL